ncbi:methylated-DNA--[protein]-cysteine S-methyltransferase [Salinibaculum rarum]|uniref:methylated-DNA--[protein]-cysteine S-methyltransferase n=1 Tax=Salinibaculum rarum TaxID=3058903 RepID=UPI0026602784|nr:methylated-DNA--[protein]-cysteine S-methyltransferase [Salinibaculum sp. KK48]
MDETAGIYARESTYLDRYVQLGLAQQRVISVSFPTTIGEDASEDHDLLDRIASYLEGTTDGFDDVDIAMTVPTDQRGVLERLREVPYGDQITVEQLVRMTPDLDVDEDSDHTLAREALAGNPAPLLIPDHRVRDGPSAAPAPVEQKLRAVEGL